MYDETTERSSGKLCTKSAGREMVWNGHLCEGVNLTAPISENFCVWTRCGKFDVPIDGAVSGDIRDVSCAQCLGIWNEENGQSGVGS